MDAGEKALVLLIIIIVVSMIVGGLISDHDKRSMCIEAMKINPNVQCFK